jgi:hypothetical protein
VALLVWVWAGVEVNVEVLVFVTVEVFVGVIVEVGVAVFVLVGVRVARILGVLDAVAVLEGVVVGVDVFVLV